MTITDEYLDELDRLDRAATKGPWRTRCNQFSRLEVLSTHGILAMVSKWDDPSSPPPIPEMNANAALIAAARTAVPALVAEVRRMRAELRHRRGKMSGTDESATRVAMMFGPTISDIITAMEAENSRLRKFLADGPYQHCTKRQEGGCVMLTENERLRDRLIKMYEDNERLRAALTLLKKMTIDNPSVPDDVVKIIMSALAGELTQPEVDEMLAKLAEGGGK